MKRRFIYTLIIGIITWVGVLLFGPVGMVSMALLAVLAFFKKKFDEREYQLLYKTNNYAFSLMVIVMVIIHQLGFHGNVIMQENWLILSLSGFYIGQGLFGLIIFNRE